MVELNQMNKKKLNSAKPKIDSSDHSLICGTWNIKRGLVTREQELINILKKDNIDIYFITETDTTSLGSPDQYKLEGYITIFPERESSESKIRILALIKESRVSSVKIRRDLMDPNFSSIWIEYKAKNKKQTLISGFYREW